MMKLPESQARPGTAPFLHPPAFPDAGRKRAFDDFLDHGAATRPVGRVASLDGLGRDAAARYGDLTISRVDVMSASKKANNLRQQNAIATAKYRRKQKEKVRRLEEEHRFLKEERDFWRRRCWALQRDGLREIPARMPGVGGWDKQSLPTPAPSTRAGRFAADTSNRSVLPPPTVDAMHTDSQGPSESSGFLAGTRPRGYGACQGAPTPPKAAGFTHGVSPASREDTRRVVRQDGDLALSTSLQGGSRLPSGLPPTALRLPRILTMLERNPTPPSRCQIRRYEEKLNYQRMP